MNKIPVFKIRNLATYGALIGSMTVAPNTFSQQLEEVVVTAQKRKESLQDVPISVSAINAHQLQAAGIQRLEDVTSLVPSFEVQQDPIGDKINIRGIQSGNQAGFEQSVGTFVDGIYRGRGTQSRFAFVDVEMVEVLRGPQGTLFGKNTIAGALNIISAKPTNEFEAEISVGYNIDFEETELQGYVSGPLTDTLRGRVYLLDRQMDEGWVENRFYDQSAPRTDESAGRLTLEWDATDNTMVSLKTEFGDFEVIGQPWESVSAGAFDGIMGFEDDLDYVTVIGANDPVLDFGASGLLDGDSQETVLTVETALDNGSDLTVIAGYSAYDFQRFLDADFGPLDALRFDDSEDFEQTSLEVRLASDTDGAFRYITGLFYQEQDLVADGLTYFDLGSLQPLLETSCNNALGLFGTTYDAENDSTAAGTAANVAEEIGEAGGNGAQIANTCGQAAAFDGAVNGLGVEGANRYALLDQTTETYAAFFQGDLDFLDVFTLTLGLRYTKEDKEASQSVHAADYIENNTVETSDAVIVGLSEAAGEFTTHAFGPNDPGLSRSEDSFTWSTNLQWQVTDDAMVYASASTGFKAGGFNSFYMGTTQGGGADSRDVGFEEEEVLSFEIGTKMTLLDGRGELNAAVFRTEFDDLQAAIFTGGTTFVVQNAAEAVSQGIEVDTRWALSDNLSVTGSVGYVDFEFKEFPNQACTADQFLAARQDVYATQVNAGDFANAGVQSLIYNNGACAADGVNDLAGRTTEHTPELQANVSANYLQSIGKDYDLDMTLSLHWRDEVYRQGDLDPFSLQDSQLKADFSAVFAPVTQQWDASLIVKNLTDEDEITYVNDTPLFTGTRQSYTAAPRSVTVRGRYRFF